MTMYTRLLGTNNF